MGLIGIFRAGGIISANGSRHFFQISGRGTNKKKADQ
jgi:hypothetical protein